MRIPRVGVGIARSVLAVSGSNIWAKNVRVKSVNPALPLRILSKMGI